MRDAIHKGNNCPTSSLPTASPLHLLLSSRMMEMLKKAKGSEKHSKWVLCLEKTVSGNLRTSIIPVTEHPSTALQVDSG